MPNKTHGLSRNENGKQTRFANIWFHIKDRCNNSNNSRYKNYGGRGIKCEWENFQQFINDMHKLYKDKCIEIGEKNVSIERINVNGNYCKKNCCWIHKKEQYKNTTRIIRYKGLTLKEWSEKVGIKTHTMQVRINRGWKIQDAIFTKVKQTYNTMISG